MLSSWISQSSNFMMAGVKNLVVKKHNLPITKIVDDIMEQKQGKYNDEYKYLDPKILRGNEGGQIPRTKTPFSDGIVFVVGGGNYIEYQNLQDYVKTKNMGYNSNASKFGMIKVITFTTILFLVNPASLRRVVYGCTQVTNSDQFLSQLTMLGREIAGTN